MNEGTNAILYLDGNEYELSHYKITEDNENYFCYNVELTISDENFPELEDGESYVARLEVNGDAVWYLPWVWFKADVPEPKLIGAVHGAIFCPFGLSEEEENKYDAMNLIIASDVCYSMTAEVWKNLLLIFSDWLKSKSVPQFEEYVNLSNEIEVDDENNEDEEEEDEDEEDSEEEEFDDEEWEEEDEDN